MNGKKILLIEDELFIRELYLRILKQAGLIVSAATDGDEGVEMALKLSKDPPTKPDLILLDIMMPRKNGIDVLKKLKSDSLTADIPVVLLTNLAQESVVTESFQLGAVGYLMKLKTTPYELVENIRPFLEDSSYRMAAPIDLE